MWRSSLNFILIATALITSSCTRPDKNDMVEGNSFYVVSAEGKASLVPVESKSTWKIPNAVNLNFTVCLKERLSNSDMRGQKFAIGLVESGKRIEEVTTLGNGCLTWSESLSFNYLAQRSTYVKIAREIIGTGVYPGTVPVVFAINPWSAGANARDKDDAVVYLEYGKNSKIPARKLVESTSVQGALSGRLTGSSKIYVPNVRLKTVREGNFQSGFAVLTTLAFEPQIKLENADGELTYVKLNGAEFDVIAHLVATHVGPYNDQKVILTASMGGTPVSRGRVEDGRVVAEIKTFLDKKVSSGNLELALKLIPRGLRGETEPFEGVFRLGDIGELAGDSSGELKLECRAGCDFEGHVKSASNFAELVRAREVQKDPGYLFENLRLRFFQVLGGETATQRTVSYTAVTCVTDGWTGDRVIKTPFNVQLFDENGKSEGVFPDLSTDETGCLRWSGEVSHKYYKPEQFLTRRVLITRGKTSRSLIYHLNPWDDKFTFGFDEREFRDGYFEDIKKRPKIPSRFFLGAFNYHTIRFMYDIDPYMQLEVRKMVLLEVEPRVLRYSGIVNARKMTEHLRDGIYLMKVAIQKNYLDPADPGRMIENKPGTDEVRLSETISVPPKEYISTRSALVRVTDGVIIQPIELTMHDLRLMRVRSNFLVQFETVDERKIQTDNVLRKYYSQYLRMLDEERRQKMKVYNEALASDSDEKKEALIKDLEKRARKFREAAKATFDEISSQLDTYNGVIEPFDAGKDSQISKSEIYQNVKQALEFNDFTSARLASGDYVNLDMFLEKDSGLDRRTFVGPVIFLSNGYSDNTRATDNLDEAKLCEDEQLNGSEEPSEAPSFVFDEEKKIFTEDMPEAVTVRENQVYRCSKYFGSLSHLVNKHVDDLIAIEKKDRAHYRENMDLVSSLYNFASTYNMSYLSLKDIPLTKYDEKCRGPLKSCIKPTKERTIPLATAKEWADGKALDGLLNEKLDDDSRALACRLMFNRIDQLIPARKPNKGAMTSPAYQDIGYQWDTWRKTWERWCRNEDNYLVVDRKLRVLDTGKDYKFLGGLQLNFNVGESFSVSRSYGWSASWGVEGTDLLGPVGLIAQVGKLGQLVKPLSLKVGSGNSMSLSEGTSISQQTYLVSQIAKFNVNIAKYEVCTSFHLSPEALEEVATSRISVFRGSINVNRVFAHHLAGGLLVCDGQVHTQPMNVNEVYFYFTQHFTEGDMLDQADLYNHPWLLGLRGIRDFSVFVGAIKVQDEVSFSNFLNGTFSDAKVPLTWPLAKMRDTYRQIMPSYPGFYTILNDEKLPAFPLESRLSKTDPDCNRELGKPDISCNALRTTNGPVDPKATEFFR